MEYVTDQIYGWNGGECPVHPESKVQVWLRRGEYVWRDAGECSWVQCGVGCDIIAFQVITPYVEPKVIWVNEYKGLCVYGSFSKEVALENADFDATRVAVKYVEAKE